MYRIALRLVTSVYYLSLRLICLVIPRPANDGNDPVNILVTGTFYSDQWLVTHLRPLAGCSRVDEVVMVASSRVPDMDGVTAVYPPAWLRTLLGEVGSRSCLFIWYGLKRRYDVIAGFHLLLNGMIAILLARLTRKRSLYFCGGGPRELEGGGFSTENRIYGRLDAPDPYIESLLAGTVREADMIITMGESAARYFRSLDVNSRVEIVPGGFDPMEFHPGMEEPRYDFILVGRLSGVKRVDLFIRTMQDVNRRYPNATAVIVGDGPDRTELENLCQTLEITNSITFAGWQNNVADWLRQSRIFVLTSESEGLSQALIQAQMCGLPAIVSNVGDLKDIVSHAENGYLVDQLTVEAFSEYFVKLLDDEARYRQFRKRSLQMTDQYKTPNVSVSWETIL